MSYAKSYQKTKNENHKNRTKAYQPRLPFRTVEGIGTEASKRLSRNAVFVWFKFYEKFNGFNRYDLSMTYREIKNKMSNTLFSRAIWELVGYGFIDVRRFGRLERNCSLFGLSNRWRKLCDEPKKLNEIEKLLNQIELLKRQPGSLKKRMKIYELRTKILKI